MKGMEMIALETKAIIPAAKLKYFEIQPIESTHLLVFSEGPGKPGRPMYIRDIMTLRYHLILKADSKKGRSPNRD